MLSTKWEQYLATLDKVLELLEANGCTVNPLKCKFGVKETDFLGHWFTPNGVCLWKKKVDAILKMKQPEHLFQLRSFIGMFAYYRDKWPWRSHILAPPTEPTGTKKVHLGRCPGKSSQANESGSSEKYIMRMARS